MRRRLRTRSAPHDIRTCRARRRRAGSRLSRCRDRAAASGTSRRVGRAIICRRSVTPMPMSPPTRFGLRRSRSAGSSHAARGSVRENQERSARFAVRYASACPRAMRAARDNTPTACASRRVPASRRTGWAARGARTADLKSCLPSSPARSRNFLDRAAQVNRRRARDGRVAPGNRRVNRPIHLERAHPISIPLEPALVPVGQLPSRDAKQRTR